MAQINLPTTLGALRGLINSAHLAKRTFGASAAPQGTDNAAQGYEVGSEWFFGAQKYRLASFTDSTANWILEAATGAQGPRGDTGPQGDTGPAGPTGPVGMNWRGAYAAGTAYAIRDAVSYDGGSYIAIAATTGNAPTNGTFWNPVALGGGGSGTVPADVPRVQSYPTGALATPFIQPSILRFDASDLPVPVGHQSVLDARHFGVSIRSFGDADMTDAAATANLAALNTARDWSAATSGFILMPGGRLDIFGTFLLHPGAGIGGIGEHHGMLRQRQVARALNETYANVIGVDPTLRGGWNTVQNMTINGGWDGLRDFEGQSTGSAWDFDRALKLGAGIEYSTRGATETSLGNGANGGPIRPGGGSDSQTRFMNLKIENCAGDGLRMFGRGEIRVNGLWTERCAREGLRTAMGDCWYDNISCGLSGDSGITLLGSASNSRWNNIKTWYTGCGKRSEGIGAGLNMPSAGTFAVIMNNFTTQDNWGPALALNGNYGIYINAQLDESAGGRPQGDGLGYAGARSHPRAHVRVTGMRQSEFHIGVTGGARNAAGEFPYLLDLAGSAIEFNKFHFYGALNAQIPQTNPAEFYEMDLTSGTISSAAPNPVWSRTKNNGVTWVAGFANANRYNEVWFESKLMHGHVTLAQLDNPAADVNHVRYGPTQVITEFGTPAYKLAAEIGGGWEIMPITRTQAQFNALSVEQRARGNFRVLA